MRAFLVVTVVAAAACDAPHTLAQMKDEGILVQVPLSPLENAALQVAIEYDAVERADCVTLPDDVRAEAGGLALSFDDRGGWQEADGLFGCDALGCGVCVPPRMRHLASDYAPDAPDTVLLEDETRSISLEIEGLFATRAMTLASPSTTRVGADVLLDYSRPNEALETLIATFVGNAQGLNACAASFNLSVPLENDGTGRYAFAVPTPQPTDATECVGPWSGTLRVSFAPKFALVACEGIDRCTVTSTPVDVEMPFTVVP